MNLFRALFFCFVLLSFNISTANESFSPKVVYGEDNRLDLFEVTDPNLRLQAESTLGIMRKSNISLNENGSYSLNSKIYGEYWKLCPKEKFYNQDILADCSGFLISKNIVITAGHCINESALYNCKDRAFIFGLSLHEKNQIFDSSNILASNVYFCKKLIAYKLDHVGLDYAIIELDREVKGREPFKYRTQGSLKVDDSLTLIGMPKGLPTKVAPQGKVTSIKPETIFSNLDAYGGNSGSVVLNSNTSLVEGILVRGATDYKWDKENQCFRTLVCPKVNESSTCVGEQITPILALLPHLPLTSD